MYLANTINGIITRNSLKGKDIIGLVGSAVDLFAFFYYFRRRAGANAPCAPLIIRHCFQTDSSCGVYGDSAVVGTERRFWAT